MSVIEKFKCHFGLHNYQIRATTTTRLGKSGAVKVAKMLRCQWCGKTMGILSDGANQKEFDINELFARVPSLEMEYDLHKRTA